MACCHTAGRAGAQRWKPRLLARAAPSTPLAAESAHRQSGPWRRCARPWRRCRARGGPGWKTACSLCTAGACSKARCAARCILEASGRRGGGTGGAAPRTVGPVSARCGLRRHGTEHVRCCTEPSSALRGPRAPAAPTLSGTSIAPASSPRASGPGRRARPRALCNALARSTGKPGNPFDLLPRLRRSARPLLLLGAAAKPLSRSFRNKAKCPPASLPAPTPPSSSTMTARRSPCVPVPSPAARHTSTGNMESLRLNLRNFYAGRQDQHHREGCRHHHRAVLGWPLRQGPRLQEGWRPHHQRRCWCDVRRGETLASGAAAALRDAKNAVPPCVCMASAPAVRVSGRFAARSASLRTQSRLCHEERRQKHGRAYWEQSEQPCHPNARFVSHVLFYFGHPSAGAPAAAAPAAGGAAAAPAAGGAKDEGKKKKEARRWAATSLTTLNRASAAASRVMFAQICTAGRGMCLSCPPRVFTEYSCRLWSCRSRRRRRTRTWCERRHDPRAVLHV